MTWRWITTLEEFTALAPTWDAALAAAGAPGSDNPYLLSEFLLTWCEAFLPANGLRILALYEDGRLCGGLPLYRAQRAPGVAVLRVVGTGFANWTEPFYTGERAAFAAACREALGELPGWRYLALPLARAPLNVGLPERVESHSADARIRFDPRWTSAADYRAACSRKTQANLRRAQRLATAAGGAELRRETDPDALAELIEFQLRYNGPDRYAPDPVVSSSPAAWTGFTRALLTRLAARGRLDAMALRVGGELAAAGFGFRHGPGYKSMLISHHPRFRRLGPGFLFFDHLIDWCLRHGDPELNMFAVTAEKRRLCNSFTPLYSTRVWPPTAGGAVMARLPKLLGGLPFGMGDSPSLRARARRSFAYRGPVRTLRVGAALARYRLRRGMSAPRPHAFDLEFGTDTVSLSGGEHVAGAEVGNGHEPIDPVDFAQLMAGLDLDPANLAQFDFIDFGSGQGRALMLAGAYPFARVLGIEYARELHESAERNLAIWGARPQHQRAGEVRSLWADAAQWELPQRPAVYYFCEPFQEPMMRRMAARLRAALEAARAANGGAPRPAYVLYVGDWFREVWEAPGDFDILAAHYFDRVYRWKGGA